MARTLLIEGMARFRISVKFARISLKHKILRVMIKESQVMGILTNRMILPEIISKLIDVYLSS
jgi:hypothetical protein